MKTDKKTILLVEDEVFIAMREKLELEQKGYAVHHVLKGKDAVKTVLEPDSPIDLILMGIDLGAGIDGIQAADEILKHKDIPVVFLSSRTEPEIVEKTEKITSYGYVVKNSGIVVLNASIKMAFKLFEARMREEKQRKALSISEKTYRNLFFNAQIGLFRTDIRTGLILDANDVVARFIGYKDRDELLAQSFNISERYVDPDDRKKIISLLKAHGEFQNFETRFRRNDHSIIWVRFSAKLVPEKGWMEGVSEDITERKKGELELIKAKEKAEESEARFKALHNASFGGISIHDNGVILECNQGLADMTGYLIDELIGMNGLLLIAEKSRDFVMKKILSEYEKPYEATGVRKNGEEFPMRLEAQNIPYKGKQVRVVEFRDITERKQAEKALRESEEKYRTLVENSSDGILMLDTERNVVSCNQAFRDLFGYDSNEIMGKNIRLIHQSEESFRSFGENAYQMIERAGNYRTEWDFAHKDGSLLSVETITSVIKSSDGPIRGYVAIIRDIKERKQAEKALRESEAKLQRSKKMESLGLLVGGVAHDLNNVLSGIVSYPELLLLDLPEESELRKPIEAMQDSGLRAVAVVQDLLTVARGVATVKKPLNLNELISDYINSPEFQKLEQFHPAIKIKHRLDTDLFNISGSHVHITKAVMNLVSNASEAIQGSGNVTISTVNRYIDRYLKGYDEVNTGEYAVLAVSDDGSGISSDDLERIFEPFYTKKAMGRSGTGLGLAVVWNVVQDHNGYINVTTDENGTVFELYFPITRDGISDMALSIPIEDYKGNRETVLVVDDVKSQRDISCKMLDTLGYMPEAVSSGEEAVEYLKKNSVDLVMLDMIMDPGINGRETYKRILKIHPDQKAIIVSGFADTDDVKGAQKSGAGKYIKKPFTLEKVGLAVKEELKK